MQVVDKRVIDALEKMPTDPAAIFRYAFFGYMIINTPLSDKYFYIGMRSTTTMAIIGNVYECIYRLIAFLILKDLTRPAADGKSYDQQILEIFGAEYRDDIKKCVEKYSKLHSQEIIGAYEELKTYIAAGKFSPSFFDKKIFDPEKVKEFIERCKAERLTD